MYIFILLVPVFHFFIVRSVLSGSIRIMTSLWASFYIFSLLENISVARGSVAWYIIICKFSKFVPTTMISSHPVRTVIPSSKLGPDNAGKMELTTHRKAIATAMHHPLPEPNLPSQSEHATDDGNVHVSSLATPISTPISNPTHDRTSVVLSDDNIQATSDGDLLKAKKNKRKRKGTSHDLNSDQC